MCINKINTNYLNIQDWEFQFNSKHDTSKYLIPWSFFLPHANTAEKAPSTLICLFFAWRALQSSSTHILPTWIIPGLMHAEDHFLSYSSVWWRTSKTRFVLGPTEKDWSESKSRQIEVFPTSAPRLNYVSNAQSGLKINQALLCGRDANMSHGSNRKLKTCRGIFKLGKRIEV